MNRLEEENIYEIDLKSFFPSVKLSAMEKILREELGCPREISNYLKEITQSITKLTEKDELDESNDRKVLLTEGQPNPNLPKELKEN